MINVKKETGYYWLLLVITGYCGVHNRVVFCTNVLKYNENNANILFDTPKKYIYTQNKHTNIFE